MPGGVVQRKQPSVAQAVRQIIRTLQAGAPPHSLGAVPGMVVVVMIVGQLPEEMMVLGLLRKKRRHRWCKSCAGSA